MRVIITGGAGFIGSHVCEAILNAGHDVTIMDNFAWGNRSQANTSAQLAKTLGRKFAMIDADVANPKTWLALERFDALIHLAAQVYPQQALQNPDLDFATNVLPTLSILNWIQRHKVPVVIYGNTGGPIYGAANHFPCDERTPISPMSPLAVTKSFFELYLSAWARSLKDSGELSSRFGDSENFFTWASFRLGNVYGPRQRPGSGGSGLIPYLTECLVSGKTPILAGDGTKTRDFIHVSDVADAFVKMLEHMQTQAVDEIFNVGTQAETAEIQVFDLILDALKEQRKTPLKITEPSFGPPRPGEPQRSCLNVNKIEGFIGWRPKKDLAHGIVEFVSQFKTS